MKFQHIFSIKKSLTARKSLSINLSLVRGYKAAFGKQLFPLMLFERYNDQLFLFLQGYMLLSKQSLLIVQHPFLCCQRLFLK